MAEQTLHMGGESPIIVNSLASPRAPARLVSGDYYCQIFTVRNPVGDPAHILRIHERYKAGEVSILLHFKLAYNDVTSEKEYVIEQRDLVKADRIEIQ